MQQNVSISLSHNIAYNASKSLNPQIPHNEIILTGIPNIFVDGGFQNDVGSVGGAIFVKWESEFVERK